MSSLGGTTQVTTRYSPVWPPRPRRLALVRLPELSLCGPRETAAGHAGLTPLSKGRLPRRRMQVNKQAWLHHACSAGSQRVCCAGSPVLTVRGYSQSHRCLAFQNPQNWNVALETGSVLGGDITRSRSRERFTRPVSVFLAKGSNSISQVACRAHSERISTSDKLRE
jgi:hypothetical protein